MNCFLIISSLLISSSVASTILRSGELSAANTRGIMGDANEKETKSLVASFHHFQPEQLELLGFDELINLMRTCKNFTNFQNIPLRFFKNPEHVRSFIGGFHGKNIDELVEFLTPEQFNEVVGIAHYFPEISVEALNNLDSALLWRKERNLLPKYIKYVTSAFLDIIFSPFPEGVHQEPHEVGTLSRNIVELIPKKVLMGTKSEIFSDIRSRFAKDNHVDELLEEVVTTKQDPAFLMQEVNPLANLANKNISSILLLLCILFLIYCTQ